MARQHWRGTPEMIQKIGKFEDFINSPLEMNQEKEDSVPEPLARVFKAN
jgi:hypothetical protein